MNSIFLGLSLALTTPRPSCTGALTYPTSTTTKPAAALERHLRHLGYDTATFRFAVIALGPVSTAQPIEIVDRFTEAMTLGHFPIVVDRGDEAEEVRQWSAGLIFPRAYVTWLGLVARMLEHRHLAFDGNAPAENIEFAAARFALYRQFEVLRNVVARMNETAEYDDLDAFIRATEVARPTLTRFMSDRPSAFAGRPAATIRRHLQAGLLPEKDAGDLTFCERYAIRSFHRRVLDHRESLRQIAR